MLPRKPKGYVGRNHETIGSDITAVLQILKLPAQVLGEEEARKLADVKPNGWYPIEWLLELMARLEAEVGRYGLVQLGRKIFQTSHEPHVRAAMMSARDLVFGLDGMYRRANRGKDIGGWCVVKFESGYAELEKTTPHHCLMEQGILSAAFAAVGCPVLVAQARCLREGADTCLFTLSSPITSEKWYGGTPIPAAPGRGA